MLNFIARSAYSKSRLFPALNAEFLPPVEGSDLTADQRVARKLLGLPGATHYGWRRLASQNHLARFACAMSQHRLAIDAEIEGKFNRADYYWRALYPDLKSLLSDNTAWSGLITSVADDEVTTEMADPIRVRSRLVCEILLDTHIGFYNGQAEDETLSNRASAHLDYILALLSISGLSDREASDLVTPAIYDRLRVSWKAGNWERALDAGESLLKYAAGERGYQSLLADLWKSNALANHARSTLDDAISRLERLSDGQPPNLDVLQTLGHLYQATANALDRDYFVAAALVAIEKALAYHPHLQEGRQIRDRLVERMKDIQRDANAFRQRLSLEPHLNANSAGQRLLLEASYGFGPMEEFAVSDEATRLSHGFRAALAFALWRDLGMDETPEDLTEKRLRLLDAVTELSQGSKNASIADCEVWDRIVSDAPMLAGIDPSAATSALERLQSGEVKNAPEPPTFTPPTDPPLLRVATRKWEGSAQPFSHWLMSRTGLRVKAQVAVAVILLVYVGMFGLHERKVQRLRDTAFSGVLQAAESDQTREVIEFAEAFLSNPSAVGNDPRDHKVLDLYELALAQWLLDAKSEPSEELSRHLDRYRSLTSALKRGEL